VLALVKVTLLMQLGAQTAEISVRLINNATYADLCQQLGMDEVGSVIQRVQWLDRARIRTGFSPLWREGFTAAAVMTNWQHSRFIHPWQPAFRHSGIRL